ncbi:WUSCHEL-related homeobox 9-like [Canna indica]|uniref:WUSCHEL-related homeobox 9-like n=1 Tax=Canna indica TaxID=4628 RepID=A0AAQ3KT60_9LILI|nr:WUSCHEL-related homeobox 9-like [Canna indica]
MASSNRHWPSMFKSKLCNAHHQWQHDINTFHQKNPYASGCEDRSPEPKPRWNPKPEQIRILEAIFNSGMVNPPRDEIRKIRAQLQEYGQVGDANVFYWFQNRKSRSKNKQRHLQPGAARLQPRPTAKQAAAAAAASSSSSSSSEQSTGSDKTLLQQPPASMVHTALPAATSLNPVYLHGPPGPPELSGEESPFLPYGHQGQCSFSMTADITGIIGVPEHAVGAYPGLWGELIGDDGRKFKMQLHHLYAAAAAAAAAGVPTTSATVTAVNASAAAAAGVGATAGAPAAIGFASSISGIQDFGESEGSRDAATSIVFTNEAAFEVVAVRINVREMFGGDAVLLDQSGHPLVTDEWGVTVHPLQDGASYYLVFNFSLFF